MNKEDKIRESSKPVVCKTFADLRSIMSVIMSQPLGRGKVKFTGKMKAQHENKVEEFSFQGIDEDINLRTMLVDGFEEIKKTKEAQKIVTEQIELAKQEIDVTLSVCDVDKARFNIDQMIENRLGGKRCGLRVRWVLQEGTYEYDPFEHKFFEVKP